VLPDTGIVVGYTATEAVQGSGIARHTFQAQTNLKLERVQRLGRRRLRNVSAVHRTESNEPLEIGAVATAGRDPSGNGRVPW